MSFSRFENNVVKFFMAKICSLHAYNSKCPCGDLYLKTLRGHIFGFKLSQIHAACNKVMGSNLTVAKYFFICMFDLGIVNSAKLNLSSVMFGAICW